MFQNITIPKIIKENFRLAFFFSFIILTICAYLIESTGTTNNAENPSEFEFQGIDTYIPHGSVLVPIEIQNLVAVDSMIGHYGLADLYLPGRERPVARFVKLIRSPKDPQQFGALVSDEISTTLVKMSAQPFRVVLQNPSKQSSNQLIKNVESKIHWED